MLFGLLYVSAWVMVWGTLGSLIDYPLLKLEVYTAGSIGQYLTFIITGILSTVIGVKLFESFKGLLKSDQKKPS